MPTWEWILAVCAGFLCIMGAIRELQHIVKDFKKPQKDVSDKLERDYARINDHDKELEAIKKDMDYIMESLMLQMKNDMVILEHMRTNNSTGKIKEREEAIKTFLLKHQQIKEA